MRKPTLWVIVVASLASFPSPVTSRAFAEQTAAEKTQATPGANSPPSKYGRSLPAPRSNPAEERILRTLTKPMEVNFIEMSLSDSIQYLSDYFTVPIRLDKETLKHEGIAPETEQTLQREQDSFQRVLNLTTAPLDVGWYIQGKEMVVTTSAAATEALRSRRESSLNAELQIIDNVCELTDAQRDKLRTAGRSSFLKMTRQIALQSEEIRRDGNDPKNVAAAYDKLDQIQNELIASLFGTASILRNAVDANLTPAQLARYAPLAAVLDAGGMVDTIRRGDEIFLAAGVTATGFSDADLEKLAGFISVGYLRLDATKITDVGLAHLKGLTNLRELFLGQTQITDAGLVHLKALKGLTVLDLHGADLVTDAGIADLKKALPNLEVKR